ncbi:hypothetical protein RMSM_07037 [Rhodopirellula maiorica SM1]|uniref:Uncharacterized protein n=1 Tax=Rhodopirellula maiorica SM1 TaxID=1265738 RepID=M5R9J7_9BACT|nr:hypothetical protein RMSM_07037 [Rhodopirellula maiorica SM1]
MATAEDVSASGLSRTFSDASRLNESTSRERLSFRLVLSQNSWRVSLRKESSFLDDLQAISTL